MFGKQRDSHAARYLVIAVVACVEVAEIAAEHFALFPYKVSVLLAGVRADIHEYAEFIAADPSYVINVREHRSERVTDPREDLVAVSVAESVIYAFEVVHIEQNERVIVLIRSLCKTIFSSFFK